MSKPVNTNPVPSAPPQPPTRGIIVAPHLEGHGPSLGRFLVVWACSMLINSTILFGAVVLFSLLGGNVEAQQPEIEERNEIVEESRDKDLTNPDIGLDDAVPLNYNLDRIEEVSVPGQVDPTAPVGLPNAENLPPMNVPPPPGTGGGTGAGVFDPNQSGFASNIGTLGGMMGIGAPGGFAGRSGATREKMLSEGGGNSASEAAVARGLEFLALHQATDGSWKLHEFNRWARTEPLPKGKVVPDNSQPMTSRRNDTGGTAFGLLPFLAAGITHKSTEKKVKDYRGVVKAGIDWLINRQSKASSDKGFYGGDMYSHSLATIAMCEAYGLTSDPLIKVSAQLGINYLIMAQDPVGGGWRYTPRSPGDTSVTGWALMALKSGQMAGLSVPQSVLKKVERYLDSCESSSKGGYGYMPGMGETPAMTAVGGLCRQYLGVTPRNPSLLATIKKIRAHPPLPGPRGHIYYEYYATQVMHHMGGDAWNFWNLGPNSDGKGGIRDVLIARQDQGTTRPGQRGSFEGDEHVGGRLGATSLSLLTLEVYYRHLPLYRRDAGMKADDK